MGRTRAAAGDFGGCRSYIWRRAVPPLADSLGVKSQRFGGNQYTGGISADGDVYGWQMNHLLPGGALASVPNLRYSRLLDVLV